MQGAPALPSVATMEEKQTKCSREARSRVAASRFQAPSALGRTTLFQLSPVCARIPPPRQAWAATSAHALSEEHLLVNRAKHFCSGCGRCRIQVTVRQSQHRAM